MHIIIDYIMVALTW